MKTKTIYILVIIGLVGMAIWGCRRTTRGKNQYHFTTVEEIYKSCTGKVDDINRMNKETGMDGLIAAIQDWQLMADSATAFIYNPTNGVSPQEITKFFTYADSAKRAVINVLQNGHFSLSELVKCQMMTNPERMSAMARPRYKDALQFYDSLSAINIGKMDMQTVSSTYKQLVLDGLKTAFKNEGDIRTFIAKEDYLFREMLQYIDVIPQSVTDEIADITDQLFSYIQMSVMADLPQQEWQDIQMFVNLRTGRRVILNAQMIESILAHEKNYSENQKAMFKWMLIQPFVFEVEQTVLYTQRDVEYLMALAKRLPGLLERIDSSNSSKNINSALMEYFLEATINHIQINI